MYMYCICWYTNFYLNALVVYSVHFYAIHCYIHVHVYMYI